MSFSIGEKSDNIHGLAVEFYSILRNVRGLCQRAKADLATDRYEDAVILAPTLRRLSDKALELQAKGVGMSILGPKFVEIYGYPSQDWAVTEISYASLKSAGTDLFQWLRGNAPIFTHNIDATGTRVYNIPIPLAKKAELETRLDAVLALFS